MTRRTRRGAALCALALTLAAAATAGATVAPLPADGSQVNSDPANSIDPARDAGVSDVAGGTTTAGNVQVPWAAFEQKTTGAQQIFVRAFKNGAWLTEGFPASLNIDPTKQAEAPAIDFAGAGRTVPWVAWYEPNANLGLGTSTQIFASRFAATSNLWLPSGQDRAAPNQLPSLNINPNRTAENPAIAGGATVAGADPEPWVAWQERDGDFVDNAAAEFQIFVSKGVKQPTVGTACTGFAPGSGNNVNGFCWQQVGVKRLQANLGTSVANGDPSLNVDPTRDGVEADIAFTGPNDTVPWVVWYEEGDSELTGLVDGTKLVFAAKGVADGTADGGFKWVIEGNGTAGQAPNVLDRAGGTNAFGTCAESAAQERACSLNKVPTNDAENPRVAAGTLTPGTATVPWVVWEEDIGGGTHAIFVSRLVGGDHFELFNSGQPISNTVNNSTRPDITFSGNTPYVSWLETVGGVEKAFLGHFEGGASAPVFKLDTPGGVSVSAAGLVPDLRAPVSSTCTANPTNADGATCQGNAVGTPFLLFADGATGQQKLFARALQPEAVTTNDATGIGTDQATLNGVANPAGGPVRVLFELGPTTAYGTATAAQRLGPSVGAAAFAALATSLTPGQLVHFRAVAQSDFATVVGADRTFTTTAAASPPAPPPAPARVKPTRLTLVLTPGKDTTAPHVFTAKGVLGIPAGTAKASACAGRVVITAKAGRRTLATRSPTLARSKGACRFTARLVISAKARRTARTVKVTARFPGNGVLLPITSKARTGRLA
ncbi:MAG: hypothetical protein R3C15_19035 [Thermoleophilia bacterium]